MQTSDNRHYRLVAPDGGWGFMVLLGTVIINTLIPGMVKSFGVLKVEFQDLFQASPTMVSWIPGVTFSLYNLLGPLASFMCSQFSCRVTTIIGALFASSGLILSSYAESIEVMFITYGILGGIGAGLSYTPTFLMVAFYFDKRRGIANGICTGASAFGSMVLPVVLRFLLKYYGCRGTLLIIGGLLLNVIVGAMLFQPVSWHQRRVFEKVDNNNGQLIVPLSGSEEDEKVDWYIGSRNNSISKDIQNGDYKHNEGGLTSDEEQVALSSTVSGFESKATATRNAKEKAKTLSNERTARSPTPIMSTVTSAATKVLKRPGSASSSMTYISTMHLGSAPTLYQLSGKSDDHRTTADLYTYELDGSVAPPKKSKWPAFCDLSLLTDRTFLMLTCSIITGGIAYTNFLVILPDYAGSKPNIDNSQAAYLLSFIAGSDLAGRLSGSFVSDLMLFPRLYFIVAGLTVSCVTMFVFMACDSFFTFAITCCFFGYSCGVNIGVQASVLVDLLGKERLGSSLGLSLALNGFFMFVTPPAVGILKDISGSYQPVIFILGSLLFVGCSIWYVNLVVRTCSKVRGKITGKSVVSSGSSRYLEYDESRFVY